jgi:hypothetical protein
MKALIARIHGYLGWALALWPVERNETDVYGVLLPTVSWVGAGGAAVAAERSVTM